MAVEIRPADWDRDREALRSIRDTVFIREQGVPPEIEWDDQEEVAQHFLVLRDGTPVGTGRILPGGKIGRMAVLPELRGTGLGLRLLQHICEFARNRGMARVYLHAQRHAEAFYRQAGFLPVGEEFEEAAIAHIRMERDLG
ncbi:GNAT family N-acetyltransferase [Microbulbifer yueqingensis]|uniref:N-acetyltransferase domain-containing protein n=1 Tax=Microbulbifer yueqingensis TaxID=658219 RepID=A0A1G8ZPA5_9GAMM|nr:GNAT family N-acetyltransferase [Microbulbifer yueqingensis]SDK16939.1 hypothetical protein SAMN05216212_1702 [Microbulbifer yueqingensis]